MRRQDIRSKLFQFKRIHKNQIATKKSLLPPHLDSKIKRKELRRMSDPDLKQLVKQIIKPINAFQIDRDKPHKGLDQFKKALQEDTSPQPDNH